MVSWLLQLKAAPQQRNSWGQTALHHAVSFDHEAVVQRLLWRRGLVNLADLDGLTPLHLAAEGGNVAIVRRLLEAGAEVEGRGVLPPTPSEDEEDNWEGEYRWTPLLFAVRYGHLEVAQLLREQGASLGGLTSQWQSALHLAAQSGNARMAQWVLGQTRGRNLKAQDRDGQTPLELAGCEHDALMQRYLRWYQHLVA